ncbi:MAG: CBASS oligonucleotide cyclase [Pseudohongiellaceae bacterium]
MKLNDQQMLRFVERIKLPADKQASYNNQIDALKKRVVEAINGMPNTKISKVKRAGSWKKGTTLRPRGDMPLDVDLVFFVDVDEEVQFDSDELRNEIITVLRKAYPDKPAEDFTSGEKTVGITFRGTGLEVDIVPFIPDKGNSSYGRQPHKNLHSGNFRTSVDKQLTFISDIKSKWSNFSSVVRIVKWWKNRQELELPSFAVELIFAHLMGQNRVGKTISIERALIEFFEFVSADPQIRIEFPGAIGDNLPSPDKLPIIADPTNNKNNVMGRISLDEWNEVTGKACEAFETISYAGSVSGDKNTTDLWREIFEGFNIQEV